LFLLAKTITQGGRVKERVKNHYSRYSNDQSCWSLEALITVSELYL